MRSTAKSGNKKVDKIQKEVNLPNEL